MRVQLATIAISAVMVSFLLLAGAPPAVAQNATKCEVKITTPQPGDKVGKSGRVRGTAKIPNGTYLWVLAHMKDLVAEWWPQGGRPAVIDPDEGWVIITGYGAAEDVNQQFEVAAVVVDANTNTRLRAWVEECKKRNDYPPIEFPDAVSGCVPVKVVVNKTSH
jgi:hypothetical protein